MNIITITLNPAIDLHVGADVIREGANKPYTPFSRESGGKGINISRALCAFAKESICCVAVGEDNAEEYLSPLEPLGMKMSVLRVPGSVRVNLHADTDEGDLVLAGQGACVDNTALLHIKEMVLTELSDGDFVCLCGTLPPFCDTDFLIDMLLAFKAKGARIILDSRSFDLADIAKIYPYMIKPNADELCDLMNSGNIGKTDVISVASALCESVAENVLVSLGKDGAIYAAREGVYEIKTPKIDVKSTTGAGDSLIAGYIYAVCEGCDTVDVLRTAVAFGTAACLREGTQPPLPDDVERILKDIKASRML